MRLALLSRTPRSYSARRFRKAATVRGHVMRVFDPLKFSILLEEEQPDLYYGGKPVRGIRGVIPRIAASVTYFGTAVVRQFEQMDIFCANPALGITNSRDKLKALQILSRHDIGIPPTTFVRSRQDVIAAIERVGGVPVIIKVLEGTQGVGVILADTLKVAETIVETLQGAKQNVLIQKFVAESKGRDVRAIVVGDQVVAAMRRVAQGGEFRANVHRGGRAEGIALDPAYERDAVRAAQILGLRVAGVDLLETHDGPQVLEVNSSPGLEGIERATRVDVAGAVLDYVTDRVEFPDLDVRQRLTVSRGYGVSEIRVLKRSALAGKTIAGTGLRDQDIVVLTINREGKVIANPKGDRVIRAGDRILCFGRLAAMKGLVPRRKLRPKKGKKKPDLQRS